MKTLATLTRKGKPTITVALVPRSEQDGTVRVIAPGVHVEVFTVPTWQLSAFRNTAAPIETT